MRLDAQNDLEGLLALVQNTEHPPERLHAAMTSALVAGRMRVAFILAMLLGNRGQWNPLVSLALALGGLLFDNAQEERRGMEGLLLARDTLPLADAERETMHARVVVPVFSPLLQTALAEADSGRLLRLMEILHAVVPGWAAGFDRHCAARPRGETLLRFILERPHRYIDKWSHYLEIYERYFARFRAGEVTLIEFGVSHGGSLQMWKDYFGPGARIFGVDIDPRCAVVNEENITVFQGNQDDRGSLRALRAALPRPDIIIDDGGHTMTQQINTLEEFFFHLKDGGIYLAEDLHTSYMRSHGGVYRAPDNFIEYTKRLIDQLNARYSEDPALSLDDYGRSMFSMHYFDSVLVIEKRAVSAPIQLQRGTPSFNNFS
ncbi:MAG: class I SAM-dependent methyltransferase [Magnetococcales bacterium]|nr:class I SAM-dependent methyltransferase [Magnetococcales bacterium]